MVRKAVTATYSIIVNNHFINSHLRPNDNFIFLYNSVFLFYSRILKKAYHSCGSVRGECCIVCKK